MLAYLPTRTIYLNLPNYIPTYLPTDPDACVHTYLHPYLHTHALETDRGVLGVL